MAAAEHSVLVLGGELDLGQLDLVEHREESLPDSAHTAHAFGIGGKAGQGRYVGVAAVRDLWVERLGEEGLQVPCVEELEAALHCGNGIRALIGGLLAHRRQAIARRRAAGILRSWA